MEPSSFRLCPVRRPGTQLLRYCPNLALLLNSGFTSMSMARDITRSGCVLAGVKSRPASTQGGSILLTAIGSTRPVLAHNFVPQEMGPRNGGRRALSCRFSYSVEPLFSSGQTKGRDIKRNAFPAILGLRVGCTSEFGERTWLDRRRGKWRRQSRICHLQAVGALLAQGSRKWRELANFPYRHDR